MSKQSFRKFFPTKEKLLDYHYRRHFIVFCLSMIAFIACTVFGLIAVLTGEGDQIMYGYIELGFALIALVNGFAGGFFYKAISIVEIVFYLFIIAILLFVLFTGGAANSTSLFWVMILPCCVYMFLSFKMASIINSFMILIVFLMFYCPPIRNLAPWLKEMNNADRSLIIRFPLVYLGTTGISVLFSLVFSVVSKENKRLISKFSRSSETDYLTQLKNRYWLAKEFKKKEELKPDDIVSVLYIDIDDFKQFNDNYGHSFGDDVLVGISNILKKFCGENVVRIGGDEFVYLALNKSSRELRNLSEKIRIAVDELEFEDNKDANVTVSIGVASLKADKNFTFDRVIAIADNQQSLAKQEGKNRVFQIELSEKQ